MTGKIKGTNGITYDITLGEGPSPAETPDIRVITHTITAEEETQTYAEIEAPEGKAFDKIISCSYTVESGDARVCTFVASLAVNAEKVTVLSVAEGDVYDVTAVLKDAAENNEEAV